MSAGFRPVGGGTASVPAVVTGNHTPSDAYTNPTDALDSWALGALWDPVAAKWVRARGDTTGGQWVQGAVASGVADTGNPVKIGGKYNATLPTFADGQRGDAQIGTRGAISVQLMTPDSATPISNGALSGDALAGPSSGVLVVRSSSVVFNGATWDRRRTPSVFKTVTATASGDNAVWTPAAGKKFRLMRYVIYVTADAARAAAGDVEIILRDATTAIGVGFSVYVPGAAGTTFVADASSGWCDLGNGFLSAAANNVLNVNLSAALTAGEVRVVAIGTEE